MEAVVLVGGLGTRLRPLTLTTPKPMIPLLNRPFLEHAVRWLADHGVDHLIFSTYHLASEIRAYFGDGTGFGLAISYAEEERPLGTAGAMRNAAPLLRQERFLLFNGDILTDLDVTALMAHHRDTGAAATVSLAEVPDPTAFGMIELDGADRVVRWVEKPAWQEVTSHWVNLGGSVFERRALEYVQEGAVKSLERDLYPALIGNGEPVFGFRSAAYWRDLGTPELYRAAHYDALLGRVALTSLTPVPPDPAAYPGVRFFGPVAVGDGCRLSPGTRIVGPACIGPGCEVAPGCTIERAILWGGVRLGTGTHVAEAIVGREVAIGAGCVVRGDAVVGEHARIGANNVLTNGVRVAHGCAIPDGAVQFAE